MKTAIIKYKDSKTLELLRSLGKYFNFSISEKREISGRSKKRVSFTVLHVDKKGYKFDRNEANER